MEPVYTVAEVRAAINRCALGEIGGQDLAEWLTPLIWPEGGEGEAVELGWRAALPLAEASSGHLSADELRAELHAIVSEPSPLTQAR